MKSSAFSGLSLIDQGSPLANGVDQRLFSPPPMRTDEDTLETTKQRANAPTLSRDNEPAHAPTNEPTVARTRAATSAATRPRSSEATQVSAHVAPRLSTRPAAGERPHARTVERHSHDIFHDQIRWLNRVKLEIEERYDVKVTGNAMVQLAIDLFQQDFVRNGEDSSLMRVLVHGEPWPLETDRGRDRDSLQAGQEAGR